MANGITIIGREVITDPESPRGNRMIVTYSVANSALINDILTRYPGTDEGSCVLCPPEGIFKTLIDGVWV